MVGPSRRLAVLAASPLLVAAMLASPATANAAEEKRLTGPQAPTVRSVPVKGPGRPADLSQGVNSAANGVQRIVRWPQPGTVEVELSGTQARKAGNGPVSIAGTVAAAAESGKVKVSILDRAKVPAGLRNGVLLQLGKASPGTPEKINVSIDYSGFATAFGADWAGRLRLVELPACALHAPATPGCRGRPLRSQNETASRLVSSQVELSKSGGETLLALTAGSSSSTGDYGATTLQASSSWSAGNNTGDFAWSYPMSPPPALGGAAPQLGLAYSSSAVDGRSLGTNNQPSWIGQGFEYWPGYIERRYAACDDDKEKPGFNNTEDVGDLCWATDNAVMSLNGSSAEFIRDDVTGVWRTKADDGTRIERLDDTGNPGDNTVNGAWQNEYWRITTADGTQYFFGRNRLSGYTGTAPANGVTNSTWLAPVAGNHSGERCHASAFASSFCNQAWRWNLDYIVDTKGNTLSYWYTKHTNKYAKNLTDSDDTVYDRGGVLDRIDYGTHNRGGTDTVYTAASAPMRVEFKNEPRCLTTSCGTHDLVNWPDTPFDRECTGSECPTNYSPTFWSTVRLGKVTTKVWDVTKVPAGYRDVTSWTLTHQFPPTGSGTPAGLWLESIVRTGYQGTTSKSLPEINFDWVALENRVDTFNGTKPTMNWHRMSTIWTETGGKISVRYTDKQCVPNVLMPGSPQTNNLRCYPVLSEENDVPKTEWFHKYLVTEVYETDNTGGGQPVVTRYQYLGDPAWRFTDDDGISKDKFRTWSEYRGYSKVRARVGKEGEENLTETTYLRGLHDSLAAPGGALKDVTVAASLGNETVKDENAFAGMVREKVVYNGVDTAPISKTVNVPRQSAATATRDMGDTTVYARFVASGTAYNSTLLDGGRGWRTTKTTTTFDSYGMPDYSTDWGLVSPNGVTDVPGDEACVDSTYIRNTTANILGLTSRVQTYALACGLTANTEADVVGDIKTTYDDLAWGAVPTAGLVTRVETLKSWTKAGGTVFMDASRTRYDAYGRPLETWDKRGKRTLTDYTPTAGGAVTKVTTTNPLNWVSHVELDIATGQPTAKVDYNGKRTDLIYDELGRLTKVWLPGRDKASFPTTPSIEHSYLIRTSGGVNAVTTKTLNAATTLETPVYTTEFNLYDGLLRLRQVQTAAVRGAGTIFSERIYDEAGRVRIANEHHHDPAKTPGTDLVTVLDWQNKSQTVTEYDRVGREIARIIKSAGVEQWRTTTAYGGDRTYVNPADGGTPTTTITDARGKTVELRQHSGGNTSGPYDATTYWYNAKGQPELMTDPAGNEWVSKFDILGRLVDNDDPDKGRTLYTFNEFGDMLTSTDARGEVLAYEYDTIGRRIGVYDDSVTATKKLATWAFDPAGAKGRLASSSRWTGTNRTEEYKVRVRGYTAQYNSTGEDYTIPTSETGLGGTYTFTRGYRMDGSPATLTYPNAGGLGGETITYTYDGVTGKLEQAQTNWPGAGQYVKDTDYTAFGEINFLEFGMTAGNWLQRSFGFDEITRRPNVLTTIRQLAPQAVTDVHYEHDAAGNVEKIVDTSAGGVVDTQCFAYDHLRRLEDAWTPTSGDCNTAPNASALGGPAPYWHSWGIDKVGNRLTETVHTASGNTTTTFAHPAAESDLPHAVTSATTPGVGTKNYAYDASGNQVCRPVPGATSNTCPPGSNSQTLLWDSEGRLSRAQSASSTSDYIYTADGERLIARDNAGTTLYLPGNELRRKASDGTVSATRYYTHAGNTCAMRTSSGVTWLVGDHQNTQSVAVAAGDQSIKQRRQLPYGTPRGSAPAWPNARGFVGGDADPTGLTHLGAREYDSSLGGFISVDPMIDPYQPQQLNAYAYGNNSPITFADPTGLIFFEDIDGNVTGGGGGGGGSGGGGGGGGGGGAGGKGDKCSAVKLNCTIAEINQMTIKERKEMVDTWMKVYAKEYSAEDWFGCILGVLDFMQDDDVAKPNTWSSWVDSTILHGVQNGLALAEGMTPVEWNPGGARWKDFFAETQSSGGADSNHARFLWSTAEQTSTEYGYMYAKYVGGKDNGTPQELSFTYAAEGYRWMLRHQGGVDTTAAAIGNLICSGGSIAAQSRCGQIAANATHDLLDPRKHSPTYLGAHIISGTEQYLEGMITGDRNKQREAVKDVVTYGSQATREMAGWLRNQLFG